MELKETIENVGLFIAGLAGLAALEEAIRRSIKRRQGRLKSIMLPDQPYRVTFTPTMKGMLAELGLKVHANDVGVLGFRYGEGKPYEMPRGLKETGVMYIEECVANIEDKYLQVWSCVYMLGMAKDLLKDGVMNRPKADERQDYYGDLNQLRIYNILGQYALPIYSFDGEEIFAALFCNFPTRDAYGENECAIISDYTRRFSYLYLDAVTLLDT